VTSSVGSPETSVIAGTVSAPCGPASADVAGGPG
jgi:hypothetical protein